MVEMGVAHRRRGQKDTINILDAICFLYINFCMKLEIMSRKDQVAP